MFGSSYFAPVYFGRPYFGPSLYVPPPFRQFGDDAGSARRWFYDKQIKELEDAILSVVKAKRGKREKIKRIVAALQPFKALALPSPVSAHLRSVETVLWQLIQGQTSYGGFADQIQDHIDAIADYRMRQRRKRDIEAVLFLA